MERCVVNCFHKMCQLTRLERKLYFLASTAGKIRSSTDAPQGMVDMQYFYNTSAILNTHGNCKCNQQFTLVTSCNTRTISTTKLTSRQANQRPAAGTSPKLKLVIVLVGVFLGDLLDKLHTHLIGIIPTEHVTDPCHLCLHRHLNHNCNRSGQSS